MEHVILVDGDDREIGTMEKMEAHQKGLLHRAFSIVLFNSRGEMLLQKRAAGKYHSGGLWTNTCCSHPLPLEPMEAATRRRLAFEMGIVTPTNFAYKFIYRTRLTDELIEHECDHVYTGVFDGVPVVNPNEVADWRFVSMQDLQADLVRHPEQYTYWFRLIATHPGLAPEVRVHQTS